MTTPSQEPQLANIKVENTPENFLQNRIISLCQELPQGVSDKLLQASMPDIDPKERATAINALLSQGKISLFKSAEKGLLYRVNSDSKLSNSGTDNKSNPVIKGDAEEKLIYKIIEEAGNKGTWIRDIRNKSNLGQTQLNKVLKSLKSKKLIKDVKSVNSTRKIVYMLYNLEPDRSITGGAWYSEQDFESEFVDVLNQQCYRYLNQKSEKAQKMIDSLGPLGIIESSQANSKDILNFISELGISKIPLKIEDIESILDTLIYDGKVQKSYGMDSSGKEMKFYRAIEPLLPPAGLMRAPCGSCPVAKNCNSKVGSVNPIECKYIKEWF